jgi:hypothetical protein
LKFPYAGEVALGLVSASFLAGCILPVPWFYHRSPDIYGVLTNRNVLVAQAKVRYSLDPTSVNCTPSAAEATTSDRGEFYLEGTQSFFRVLFIIPAPMDSSQKYRICFEMPDGMRSEKTLDVFWGGPISSIPPGTPAFVTTVCDITDPDCFAHPQ